jgi:GNAT superfamily N-acetyltransferase
LIGREEQPVRLVDVDSADPLLVTVFDEVLAPSFPPDELGTVDGLRAGVADGSIAVTALVEDDRPVAVAVGEWSPDSRVLLLAYLAARPGERSRGFGGKLLGVVNGAWQARFEPLLTLAEIEHPGAHGGTEAHGDPAQRLRFYARHGVRALDLPYFQPALHPGAKRVYGLLLSVLAMTPEAAGGEEGTVDPVPVKEFLTEYLEGTEGKVGDDPATKALWAALDRPGIPLLDLDDPTTLPISRAT